MNRGPHALHQQHTVLAGAGGDGARFGGIDGERFLAQDVLARLQAQAAGGGVLRMRRGNVNGMYVRVGRQRLVAGMCARRLAAGGALLGRELRGALGRARAHRHQPCPGRVAQASGEPAGNAARPQNAPVHHLRHSHRRSLAAVAARAKSRRMVSTGRCGRERWRASRSATCPTRATRWPSTTTCTAACRMPRCGWPAPRSIAALRRFPGRRQRRWKRLVGARAGEPFQGDREVAQPVAGGGMAAAQLQQLALHARIRVEQRGNLVAGAL